MVEENHEITHKNNTNVGRELKRWLIYTTEEKSGMKNIVLCGMTPYSPVEFNRYFTLLTPSPMLVSYVVYSLRLKNEAPR